MKKKKWEWTATCGDYSATGSSDYPNDWNATIRAIETRGWEWWTSNFLLPPDKDYKGMRQAFVAPKHGPYISGYSKLDEPPCVALMRAAVEAAKSIDKQTMDDNL